MMTRARIRASGEASGSAGDLVPPPPDVGPEEDVEEPERTYRLPQDVQGKVAEGERLKGLGNEAFTAGKVKKALRLYKMVFLYTTGLPGMNDELKLYEKPLDEEQAKLVGGLAEFNATVHNNIAQCCVQLGKYEDAYEHARKTLDVMPTNVKALYRAAKAKAALGDDDAADRYYTEAAKLHTKNDAFAHALRQELKVVRDRMRASDARFGKGFAAAFGRSADDDTA